MTPALAAMPGMLRSPFVLSAAVLVVAAILLSVFAPVVAPADPLEIALRARYLPPFWLEGGTFAHPLGTDQLGRDLAARVLYGLRVSLLVGLLAATLSAAIGAALGLIAGFAGRGWEAAIMRVADVQLAFPLLVLAIAIIGIVGPGLGVIILLLGLWGWATFARVVRAEALVQKQLDYVQAARAVGSGTGKILLVHVLPNLFSSVIVLWTFAVAQMIIIEGALSFLGLGVRPPNPSLGGIINEGRTVIATAWWVTIVPGVVLVLLVVALNTLGDALRDHLDPRLRR